MCTLIISRCVGRFKLEYNDNRVQAPFSSFDFSLTGLSFGSWKKEFSEDKKEKGYVDLVRCTYDFLQYFYEVKGQGIRVSASAGIKKRLFFLSPSLFHFLSLFVRQKREITSQSWLGPGNIFALSIRPLNSATAYSVAE